MALHNLVITVVDGGKATSTSSQASNTQSNKKKGSAENNEPSLMHKILNYNETAKNWIESKTNATTAYSAEMGFQIAKQVVMDSVNFYVSDIGRRNGDDNYQAQINRTVEIVEDGLGIIGGAFSGAAAGAAAGPIGILIGAVAGLVSSSLSTGFKYAERQRAYQHEMFKENTSQAYNLARANYSAFTGRVR